jgi:hypothetical protein
MRRALGLLLVLSWIALSGVDALEDLDFDSHTVRHPGAASGWPNAAKPVKLANNILELANNNARPIGNLIEYLNFEDPAHHTFADTYLAIRALRKQKEHCVLVI